MYLFCEEPPHPLPRCVRYTCFSNQHVGFPKGNLGVCGARIRDALRIYEAISCVDGWQGSHGEEEDTEE